jgi:hypothetical protein
MNDLLKRAKHLSSVWWLVVLLVLSGCARVSTKQINSSPERGVSASAMNFAAPLRVSAANADAAEPALATGRDGMAFVVWVEHADTDADVFLARLTAAAEPAGEAVRVNSKPGVATAWRGDQPTIAVAPDGTVYVGWTGRQASGSGHTSDLYLSASRDGGKSFEAPVKVNDDKKPAVHGMHSLAVDAKGRIHLAWLDERNIIQPHESMKAEGHHMESNREVYATFSTDGGRTFAANKQVATNACPCCKTALAVGAEGRVYLSWRQVLPGDFRHIAVSSSADEGKTFSPGVIVSDDRWSLKGCPVSGASLFAGADGSLKVVWFSAGERGEQGLYQAESRDAGLTFSPRQLVAASSTRGTPVLTAGTAVWEGEQSGQQRVMSTQVVQTSSAPASSATPTMVGEGQLPAAATSGERMLIAYIVNAGERRSVFVVAGKTS